MRTLSAVLAVSCLLALAPSADAVLCRKKSGAVSFRDECRRKEVAIDPAQAGLVGPKGDAGPPGQGQPRLFLTDATDTRLPGFVNGRGQLVYPHEGEAFAITVTENGFRDVAFFLYESDDCTGQRLVFGSRDIVQFANVLGGLLYYAVDPPEMRTYNSTANVTREDFCTGTDVFDPTTGLCCRKTGTPQMDELSPAVTVDLRGFVPPFTLGLEQ